MNIYQYTRDISLLLIAGLVVTIIMCASKFEEAMQGNGAYLVFISIALLLIYGGISYRIPAFASRPGIGPAVMNGTVFGCITGIIWIANLSVDHFISIAGNVKTVLGLIMMVAIFALYWIAAFRTILKTGKIPASLFAAVWCAMTGVLLLFVYEFVLYFAGHQKVEADLQQVFVSSGMHDLTAFVILNILRSGSTHLIAAPVISVIFGATSVLIVQISSKLRK